MGARILILKTGAMGDVVRTTPLITGLKKRYPHCQITWVTFDNIAGLLQGIGIDRLLLYSWQTCQQLAEERFDIAICLDKETDILALMNRVSAPIKYGYLLSEYGNAIPAHRSSEYLYLMGISDELKFRQNQKSYTRLVFEAVEIPYDGEKYLLTDLSAEQSWVMDQWKQGNVPDDALRIAFNTGAGKVFATKKWSIDGYAGLGKMLIENFGARIFLLGGELELERNHTIASRIGHPGKVMLIDTRDSLQRLAALIGKCHLMVTGDTLGLHLAIATGCPSVALFGPTCHQEIDLFGKGAKVISDFPCCPCYRPTCSQESYCMDAISSKTVFYACRDVLASAIR